MPAWLYFVIGWFVAAALIMMLTRRSWWEWDPSEPRPRPAPIQRPAKTADRLVRQLHHHDQEEAEARHAL